MSNVRGELPVHRLDDQPADSREELEGMARVSGRNEQRRVLRVVVEQPVTRGGLAVPASSAGFLG